MSPRFFYDSYAVMAYTSGHQTYKQYFEEHDDVLTKLNLLEIFYRSLEEHNFKIASDILKTSSKYPSDFGLDDISGSMRLRLKLKHEGRDLSCADALGYFISQPIKFLTGDSAFQSLDGVEYVQ